MESEIHALLANIWYCIIGLILILYVVLDGFDLGVGILTLLTRNEEQRTVMMASLGSVWDANETWLVLLAGALFGAFPAVYAGLSHALYIPVMAMLFGLIFRGVALEFRSLARSKTPWNIAFGGGSLLAATAQGFSLGGLLAGLPMEGGKFIGGGWEWVTPYSALGAFGVVLNYTLFGATYLIIKTEGPLQQSSIRLAKSSAVLLVFVLVAMIGWAPVLHPYVARRWAEIPVFNYLAFLLALALYMLLRSLRSGRELGPFFWSVIIFLLSFALMVLSHYPYLIPPRLTIEEAASSSRTLIFMLTGIGMLLPVMLIYNSYQYLVFRGKVRIRRHKAKAHA